MTHYIGTDIVEIARIQRASRRWGDRFLHRVYTEPELKRYQQNHGSLAARFACKEAVMKLLDADRKGISWQDIETLSSASGKPLLKLHGRGQSECALLGIKEIAVSLAHSRDYAIAAAI